MVLLGISEGGFAYLMADKPLRQSADLNSQKVWIPEGDIISQSIFEKAGVTPVSLPISDVYTGLQTGLINTVGVNPTGAIALQWHTKIKYVTDEPLLFLMGTMVVSKKAFKKVNAADQKVVKNAVSAAFARLDAINLNDDDGAREALKSTGIEFVNMTDADRLKWKAIAKASLQDLAEKDVYPVELLQQVQDSLSAFRAAQ
jgi:TRAP-type C4-dicarboxylate transport system substrate-binding protein